MFSVESLSKTGQNREAGTGKTEINHALMSVAGTVTVPGAEKIQATFSVEIVREGSSRSESP